MVVGRPRPWLPRRILDHSVARTGFASTVGRTVPYLRIVERVLQPRFPEMTRGNMERLIGVVCCLLAVLISLPIPFTGIPLAIPVLLLSLGLIERDGAFVIFGLAAAAVAGVYALTLAQTAVVAILYVLRGWIGT
jgi:hypothetical protein